MDLYRAFCVINSLSSSFFVAGHMSLAQKIAGKMLLMYCMGYKILKLLQDFPEYQKR